MTTIKLDNYQLEAIQEKNKLYTYLSKFFTKLYFKISSDTGITFALRGVNGLIQTSINTDYTGDTIYFSTDFKKWQTALQKFSGVATLYLRITTNMMKISDGISSDFINLSIATHEDTSSEAIILNTFATNKSQEILSDNLQMTLSDELLNNFDLADSLFVAQADVNSIGVGKNSIIYADRSVVLKLKNTIALPDELFANLGGEDYIFIHTNILKLFPLLYKFDANVHFSSDYGVIYWKDSNSQLILASENREVGLPTDEEWRGIKPINTDSVFEVNLAELKNCLAFFNGFYEACVWKPLTFEITANKEIVLRYRHPTAEITKTLNAVSSFDGTFTIVSEILEKILGKICSRYTEDTMPSIIVNFDEEGLGIYCSICNDCEFVLSKLTTGEENF